MLNFPEFAVIETPTEDEADKLYDFLYPYMDKLHLWDTELSDTSNRWFYHSESCYVLEDGRFEENRKSKWEAEYDAQKNERLPYFKLPPEEWFMISVDEFIRKCQLLTARKIYVYAPLEKDADRLVCYLDGAGYRWAGDRTLRGRSLWHMAREEMTYLLEVDKKLVWWERQKDNTYLVDNVNTLLFESVDAFFDAMGKQTADPCEDSCEDYDEIIPIEKIDHTTNDYQEEKKMENTINNTTAMNMFGIECGMNQDQNITSTIFGVAVKVGDSWRAFDKKNRAIQNIGNINLGEFPVLLMPSKKVNVGDLIKDAGQYLYVTEVLANGNIKAISVEDGTVSERIPTQLIGGMKLFTKVITLMDDVMDVKSDFGMLMLMSCMSGGAPMDMNQMFPLMLLSDSNNGNESGDDSDKLFKMMMLMSAMGGSQQNPMLPLLLMKSL